MNTTTHATTRIVATRTIRNGKVTLKADPTFAAQDAPMMTAYDLGLMDAEDGELCLPELYYVKGQDKYEYALGYSSVYYSILAQQVMERFESAQYEMAELERDEAYDAVNAWQS